MPLRMILGRAGTGKTYTCLQELSQECNLSPTGAPLLLIVPEQATFQMEYELNTAFGLAGTMRARVLNLRRLAFWVLAEAGGHSGAPVDSLRQQLELERILQQRKQQLQVLKLSAGEPGLAQELAAFIGEMKRCHISPADLREKAERLAEEGLDDLSGVKLRELADLYEAWNQTGLTDPQDFPDLVAKRIRETELLQGAKVWLDGFREFSAQELALIAALVQVAAEVSITLYCEPTKTQSLTESDLFYPTSTTLKQLLALAGRTEVDPATDLLLQVRHRFTASPAGAALEASLVDRETPAFVDTPRQISLQAAINRRAELEGAAREILRLCREEGYRWRDIAVLARDLTLYQDLFPVVFKAYGIPYYWEEYATLAHHPLVELIRSALEVVQSDWSYAAVFRYLKSGLTDLGPEEVDGLENYVLEHGIQGKCWYEPDPWSYVRRYSLGEDAPVSPLEEENLAALNALRSQAAVPLRALQLNLERGNNSRAYTLALFTLLEELQVSSKLTAWSKDQGTDSHALAWEKVLNMFDTLVQASGEGELSLAEYVRVLGQGLEGLQLPRKLPGLDEVLLCPPEQCFNPNLKAALVLGLNEGVFPARVSPAGLLTEAEREALQKLGLAVAPGIRTKALGESLLVYLGLTRAAKLWLSYALADLEGKAQRPSTTVRRLKEIFPNIKEGLLHNQPILLAEEDRSLIASPGYDLNYLAGALREATRGSALPELWWQVYNWALQEPKWQPALDRVVQGLKHQNQEQPLGPELARQIFGTKLNISVTRLEKYNACPFSHFATYALKLKDRQAFNLDAAGMGDLFHAALKQIGLWLKGKGVDWADLTEAECREYSRLALAELAPQLRNEILFSSERHKYLSQKLLRVLTTSTWALGEQARRGSFRALGYELGFGGKEGFPSVLYPLGKGAELELVGKIDRVDTAVDSSGRTLVRIIDYKSGRPSLTLDDMYYGLKLQLLTYQLIAAKGVAANAVPAGFLYFYLSDPLLSTKGPLTPEERDKKLLSQFRLKGFVRAEAEIIRLMEDSAKGHVIPAALTTSDAIARTSSVLEEQHYEFFRNHLEGLFKQAAQEILAGNIAMSPYSKGTANACTYCQVKPLCGFDLLLPENKFRRLRAIPDKKFWEQVDWQEPRGVAADEH